MPDSQLEAGIQWTSDLAEIEMCKQLNSPVFNWSGHIIFTEWGVSIGKGEAELPSAWLSLKKASPGTSSTR